jgi:hypothetical protein
MADRAAAPTRVTVARIERAERPSPARTWRPRTLLEPLFKREPFDLFAALTAHLVEADPEQQASRDLHHACSPPAPAAATATATNVTPADAAGRDVDCDESSLARLALIRGFSFGAHGSIGREPAGYPWAFADAA